MSYVPENADQAERLSTIRELVKKLLWKNIFEDDFSK